MKSRKDCPKRCAGRILDKEQGRYCACIESKIPRMDRGRMPIASQKAKRDLSSETATAEACMDQLERKLKDIGLLDYQVKLVCARYGENRSFSSIAEDLGWTTGSRAAYHLKQALQVLRKRGFK